MTENIDKKVVAGFGDEWSRFDQSALSPEELESMFDNYFHIFPWDTLPHDAVGFDLGCGSGRWARLVAPRVGKLHLIDPSDALEIARRNLADRDNCEFHRAGVDNIPLESASCDFGYCLGVLHHIRNTEEGLEACVDKLKPGAPFLLYLYYRFDNRPFWYKAVWKTSELIRYTVSRLPFKLRFAASQALAATVYFPMARTAKVAEKLGANVKNFPLAQYRNNSFYVMRTDALDFSGTLLEKRYTKKEMQAMMEAAGLEDIVFSDRSFWTALGYKEKATG